MGVEETEDLLRIATVGAPHGLRGEVRLILHTDDPEGRLAVGTRLVTEPAAAGPVTVTRLTYRDQRWYATLADHADRTAVEALRGVVLLAAPVAEEDAWYPHELKGLAARRPDGTPIGVVQGLEHYPAQDVLVIRETGGERTMVPFVRALVPVVDVPGGFVTIDAPPGLLAADGDPETDLADRDEEGRG